MTNKFLSAVCLTVVIFGSCQRLENTSLLGDDNQPLPGAISVNVADSSGPVTGFQADVTILRKDNRSVHGFQKVARYKLSSKMIDGVLKSRMEI